ncbi:ubiquitin-related domain-containing protein [Crepidotus variabilis]|uniref:Ubiquitin-related domain-containing protein n=1 Tax=Crepidotus variabilis TaxID=179855 RepID=A0A9P6JKZ6_9AGAR|nr:ubiquitin-related domain-containing protein [Crepidotus variabilis]
MSQEPEDVKPKLNLVIAYEGQQITVKVKTNMKFGKIFEAATQRFGKDSGTFRFTYDGNRINADDTPADLSMEDGDQVDAHLQQVGGGHIPWRSASRY